jgi:hypothetical protein
MSPRQSDSYVFDGLHRAGETFGITITDLASRMAIDLD